MKDDGVDIAAWHQEEHPVESEALHEIQTLVEKLKPEDRERLRAMPESELVGLHRGYGTWLRNQFRQNGFPHLFKRCSAAVPPESRSFDAISAVAIREIWLHIRLYPRAVGPRT